MGPLDGVRVVDISHHKPGPMRSSSPDLHTTEEVRHMASSRAEGVVHAVITVHDMEEALAFYRDLLGMTVRVDIEHEPGPLGRMGGWDAPDVRAVILDLPDGTELELAEFRRPKGRGRVEHTWPDAGINSVTLKVSGLDDLMGRISAAGHAFLGEVVAYAMEEGGSVRVVYCQGPDGVILTLAEPA